MSANDPKRTFSPRVYRATQAGLNRHPHQRLRQTLARDTVQLTRDEVYPRLFRSLTRHYALFFNVRKLSLISSPGVMNFGKQF